MKLSLCILAIAILAGCAGRSPKTEDEGASSADQPAAEPRQVYHIIRDTNRIPGLTDTAVTAKLTGPIKALAAFYAAMGGTNCDGENCELTTALGLGEQGSDKHKALIRKYFPDDPVAATVLAQDCYLRPSGASTFSDFRYLTITDLGDTVKVDYSLMYYNRGEESGTEGPDTYLFRDGAFSKLSRNLWTHVDN